MSDPEPSRPDPGRDSGGSWLLAGVFMAVCAAVAIWWGLLMAGVIR
jgi:hypothetical protein